MSEKTPVDVETEQSRAAVAAVLSKLADGFAGEGAIEITAGESTVTVAPPNMVEFELEVEFEEAEDEMREVELEVEIEWEEPTDGELKGGDGTEKREGGDELKGGDERDETRGESESELDTDELEPESADETEDRTDADEESSVAVEIDATEKPSSQARFELYEDRAGQWRWRLVHRNGNILGDSGEGYASKQKARQGLDSVRRNAPDAPTTEVKH